MKGRLLVALIVLAACRQQPSIDVTPVFDPGTVPVANVPVPVPAPAPAGAGRLRFGPSALRYVIQQQVRIEHDRADLPPVTQLGWRTYVASTITGPADATGYPAIFTVDSIVVDSGVVLPSWMDPTTARGLRFVGRLAPTGEFLAGQVSDSASADKLAMLIGRFRTFYPRIPATGIAEGDNWTDTVTVTDSASGRLTRRRSIRQVRAAGWEETPAGRALRIETNEQFEQTESGSGGGQPFNAKGTGVGSSVERIGAAGRYLGAVARDSANLTITLSAQGLIIPRRQITTTVVTVLP
jgi:hypothetical protein